MKLPKFNVRIGICLAFASIIALSFDVSSTQVALRLVPSVESFDWHSLQDLERCSQGPYVWVPYVHQEGIGATMRVYRKAFLLSNAVNAKLIISLYNDHTPDLGDIGSELGVSLVKDCTERNLQNIYTTNPSQIQSASDLFTFGDFQDSTMCANARSGKSALYRRKYKLGRHSIILMQENDFSPKPQEKCLESCMFSERMRSNFRRSRRLRGFVRPLDEVWAAVHFRWRDVAVEKGAVDIRTGAALSEFMDHLDWVIKILPLTSKNAPVLKYFVLTEGEETEFRNVTAKYPSMIFHGDSEKWQTALDILSQSSVIIGGQSSFFSLGSNLCDDCYAITLPDKSVRRLPDDKICTEEGE